MRLRPMMSVQPSVFDVLDDMAHQHQHHQCCHPPQQHHPVVTAMIMPTIINRKRKSTDDGNEAAAAAAVEEKQLIARTDEEHKLRVHVRGFKPADIQVKTTKEHEGKGTWLVISGKHAQRDDANGGMSYI